MSEFIEEYEAILPQSLEAERAVLGCLLLDNSCYSQVSDFLSVEDFYSISHQIIYRIISEFLKEGKAVDAVILHHELQRTGEIEAVGGIGYVAGHIDVARSTLSTEHYGRIVREKARLRAIIKLSQDSIQNCYKGEESATVIHEIDRRIAEVYPSIAGSAAEIAAIANSQADFYQEMEKQPPEITGIPSGLIDLDRLTDGFQMGELSVIAARPSMGKTAFAGTVIVNNPRKRIAFFSIEMKNRQIVNRMVAKMAQIDGFNLRRGKLDAHEWKNAHAALMTLATRKLWIYEGPATLNQIRTRCRKLVGTDGLQMVVIDYLSLIRHTLPKNQQHQRRDIVTEISHTLKNLAAELNIAILLLHQLNRDAGSGDQRPSLHQLRESGDVEADADLVLLLWDDKGKATCTIGKQRNGPVADVPLLFMKEHSDFRGLYEESRIY